MTGSRIVSQYTCRMLTYKFNRVFIRFPHIYGQKIFDKNWYPDYLVKQARNGHGEIKVTVRLRINSSSKILNECVTVPIPPDLPDECVQIYEVGAYKCVLYWNTYCASTRPQRQK